MGNSEKSAPRLPLKPAPAVQAISFVLEQYQQIGRILVSARESGAFEKEAELNIVVAGLLVSIRARGRPTSDPTNARTAVQVLRLMEVFRLDEVAAAVRNAIARGAIGFDAVKHLMLCHIERRPPRLDMTVYPYLPQAHVAMTLAKTYLGLLMRAA